MPPHPLLLSLLLERLWWEEEDDEEGLCCQHVARGWFGAPGGIWDRDGVQEHLWGGWEHFLGSLVAQNPKIFLWSHPRSISFRMNPKPLRFSCGHFLAGVRIDPTPNGYTGVTGCSGHPRVDCTLHGTSGFQIVDQHRV